MSIKNFSEFLLICIHPCHKIYVIICMVWDSQSMLSDTYAKRKKGDYDTSAQTANQEE